MAEFLAVGDPDVALGAKSVPGLRMQQKTPADLTIPLALFVFGLTMGTLGHMNLQTEALRTRLRQAHKILKPLLCQLFFVFWRFPPSLCRQGQGPGTKANSHTKGRRLVFSIKMVSAKIAIWLVVAAGYVLFYNNHKNS
jgi:hypothetical protein